LAHDLDRETPALSLDRDCHGFHRVRTDGALFLDASHDSAPGGPDGIRVGKKGNLYGAGPGGVWIISPEGKHLGTINGWIHLVSEGRK